MSDILRVMLDLLQNLKNDKRQDKNSNLVVVGVGLACCLQQLRVGRFSFHDAIKWTQTKSGSDLTSSLRPFLSSPESLHALRDKSTYFGPSQSCSACCSVCLRCCVSLWGYLTLTSFTRQPLLVCEDPHTSLSDLSNNTWSWNRGSDIDRVEWDRQLCLLWKPWQYTHTMTD